MASRLDVLYRSHGKPTSVKQPAILDDPVQKPSEELESLVGLQLTSRGIIDGTCQQSSKELEALQCGSHNDEGLPDPVRSLLAMVEAHHSLLCAHVQEKHFALLKHIDGLTLPSQQSSSGLFDGGSQQDTRHGAKGERLSMLREATQHHGLDKRVLESCAIRLPDSNCNDVGCDDFHSSGAGAELGTDMADHEYEGIRKLRKSGTTLSAASVLTRAVRLGNALIKEAVSESRLDIFVSVLIVANVIVIILQSQWEGYKASVALGREKDFGGQGVEPYFDVCQHAFTGFYILELLIRLRVHKLEYFKKVSNVFDTCLVLFSLVELAIMVPLGTGSSMSFYMLRLVRLCKLVRVLRVVRVMRLVQSLHVLVHSIMSSIPSLVWSMVLLFLLILMSGLFLCQFLADYILEDRNPFETREWVYTYYGGAARATLTMFEATMSGCWPNYSRTLIEDVSPWYALFFVFYIAGVVFAVTRVISAIFLRETMQVASQQADMLVAEMKMDRDKLVAKLRVFFEQMKKSADGMVDREEFEAMLKEPKVRMWFRGLDLHIHEYVSLYNLINTNDLNGTISLDDFVDGVSRLKGQARSVDILSVGMDVRKIKEQVEDIANSLITLDGGKQLRSK